MSPSVPSRAGAARRIVAALATLVAVASCDTGPLVAPDGSRIELGASRTTLAAEGDSAVVTALVTESDGIPVENGTEVSLVTTGGGLCPATQVPTEILTTYTVIPDCSARAELWPSAVVVKTKHGIATAVLKSTGVPGPVVVRARSGDVADTLSITISTIVAPGGARAIVQADPDTILVGGTSRIRAFLTDSTGAPVANDLRVAFVGPDSTIPRGIALTRSGFAETTYHGWTAGRDTVVVTSGTLRSQVVICVSESATGGC
jgi:hypothetical protein